MLDLKFSSIFSTLELVHSLIEPTFLSEQSRCLFLEVALFNRELGCLNIFAIEALGNTVKASSLIGEIFVRTVDLAFKVLDLLACKIELLLGVHAESGLLLKQLRSGC